MPTVETIGRIRREHFIKGKTIRQISRDLKVFRNTARKVPRSGARSFEYERDVQPRRKLGRWTTELAELLEGRGGAPRLPLSRSSAPSASRRAAMRQLSDENPTFGCDGQYSPLSSGPEDFHQRLDLGVGNRDVPGPVVHSGPRVRIAHRRPVWTDEDNRMDLRMRGRVTRRASNLALGHRTPQAGQRANGHAPAPLSKQKHRLRRSVPDRINARFAAPDDRLEHLENKQFVTGVFNLRVNGPSITAIEKAHEMC